MNKSEQITHLKLHRIHPDGTIHSVQLSFDPKTQKLLGKTHITPTVPPSAPLNPQTTFNFNYTLNLNSSIRVVKLGGIEDLNFPQEIPNEEKTSRKVPNIPSMIRCQNCDTNFPTKYQFQRHQCEFNAEKVVLKPNIDVKDVEKGVRMKFDCPTCGKQFVSKNNLERHLTSHDEDNVNICEFCNKHFVSENRLRIHKENHCKKAGDISKFYRSDVTVWKCVKCNQVFSTDSFANLHADLCTEILDQNDFQAKTDEDFEGNKYVEKVLTELLLQCEYCNKTYSDKKSLLIHQKTHSTEVNYKCVVCNEVFESYITAGKHWLTQCSNEANLFYLPKLTYCQFCDRTFKSHEVLYSHKIKKKHYTPKKFATKKPASPKVSSSSPTTNFLPASSPNKFLSSSSTPTTFCSTEVLSSSSPTRMYLSSLSPTTQFLSSSSTPVNFLSSNPPTTNYLSSSSPTTYFSSATTPTTNFLSSTSTPTTNFLLSSLTQSTNFLTPSITKLTSPSPTESFCSSPTRITSSCSPTKTSSSLQISLSSPNKLVSSSSPNEIPPTKNLSPSLPSEFFSSSKLSPSSKTEDKETIIKLIEDVLCSINVADEVAVKSEVVSECGSVEEVKKRRGRKRKHSPGKAVKRVGGVVEPGFKYQCERCVEVFDCVGELEGHRDREHPANYKCEECDQVVHSSKALLIHSRAHQSLKPYVCEICKRCYSQTSHLWQHMRFHQGIKPFACPHEGCEARYTIRPDLKDHIRKVHTRERPFKCSVCDKCFLTGSVYYQHRLIHTNDRRYACDICNKRFFRADALNNHRRIHTDERPYPCDVCGRHFRQKGDRNKHVRTQHPEYHT